MRMSTLLVKICTVGGMAGKPNKAKERAAGYGGATLGASWLFWAALHVVDWLGRAQTAMTVAPYVGILSTPLALLLELLTATGLLLYATRLEQDREAEEAPRIILPFAPPVKPNRHWYWIKLSIITGAASLVAALCVFAWIRVHRPQPINSATVETVPKKVDSSVTPKPNPPLTEGPSAAPATKAPPSKKAEPLPTSTGNVTPPTTPDNRPSPQQDAGPSGGPLGPIMAAELVQLFKSLSRPCAVMVTSAEEKSSLRNTLAWLLTQPQRDGGAECSSWTNRALPNADDPEPASLPSNVPGIVVHWSDAYKDGERVSQFFDADGMKVSVSHRMPRNSPSYLVWLDLGPGSPWK